MKSVKTINGLMKYLRETHNININGSLDKKNLKNVGYYHGYKGYRYIKKPLNRINFNTFDEIMAIINFDNKLKALLYPQVMFIETALKSYALEIIIQEGKTENFNEIYSKLMTDYKSHQNHPDNYKKAYIKRLNTYNKIQTSIVSSYNSDNNIVSHYIQKDESLPIWAIFEIITLGEFGNLISTFNISTRKSISKDIGFNISFDSSGKLFESIIFALKDLRNSIAHNNVIFDTRFKKNTIPKIIPKILVQETKVQNILFSSITDYLILIIYVLKTLKKSKTELSKLINDYIKLLEELKLQIPQKIYDQIILTNDKNKLNDLKNFIKK